MIRDLKYYDKKLIMPGESAEYSFTIRPNESLWFPDKTGTQILEDGYFTFDGGQSESEI